MNTNKDKNLFKILNPKNRIQAHCAQFFFYFLLDSRQKKTKQKKIFLFGLILKKL